jgi:hypothetical protein
VSRVFSEGGQDLVNPTSALLNTRVDTPASRAAADFARWMSSEEAQEIIRHLGKNWSYSKALLTVANQDEFEESELLARKL